MLASVVAHGSLTSAARELGTTTSAVSKRIARLEERLGTRLLERTTRRVALTDAGQELHERAIAILAAVDDAEAALTRHAGTPRGTLRVSAPVILGERHLAPLLGELVGAHPELHVDLALADRFVNLVEEGFDVAVRIGRLDDSSLKVRRLARVPVLVVGSPAYLARRGTPRRPEDLARHECLRYSLVPARHEWRFRVRGREVSVATTGRVQINHGGAMREAVLAGLGLAVLPKLNIAEELRDGRLVSVLEEYHRRDLEIAAVRPAGRQPLPKVEAFIRLLAARLPARLG